MQGIVLNEGGYVTYLSRILPCIESEVKVLNWHISNLECYSTGDAPNPFEVSGELFLSGEEFYDVITSHPDIQFVWGLFSGFPQSVDMERLKSRPSAEIRYEIPYMGKALCHIEPDAVLEILAFDSSETHVLTDREQIADKLRKAFPKAEPLS